MSDDLLLTLLWAIPLLGSIVVLLIPKRLEEAVRITALVASTATFALTRGLPGEVTLKLGSN